jgi:hypothetical protein
MNKATGEVTTETTTEVTTEVASWLAHAKIDLKYRDPLDAYHDCRALEQLLRLRDSGKEESFEEEAIKRLRDEIGTYWLKDAINTALEIPEMTATDAATLVRYILKTKAEALILCGVDVGGQKL